MEVDQSELLATIGELHLRNRLLAQHNAALTINVRRLEARVAELESTEGGPPEVSES